MIELINKNSRMRFKMSVQKTIAKIDLRNNEKKALEELKEKILKIYPEARIILYGSKARGDFDRESDIDLLILIPQKINTKLEEEIYHISYEIELKYNVVFGEIIENKKFWETPLANVMPLYQNIDKEGIAI
jgi:uncharacterized protein